MKTPKSKTFLHRWIYNISKKITNRGGSLWGHLSNYIKKMSNVTNFIHELNREAYKLNKNIVAETNTMKKVPLNETIYNPVRQPVQQVQQPSQPVQPVQPVQQVQLPVSTTIPTYNVNEEKINEFINQLSSVEKKIDRFFNLIEKRVVKNAKEINIRIKLSDLNENNNTEQE